jgi:hypothetical protein
MGGLARAFVACNDVCSVLDERLKCGGLHEIPLKISIKLRHRVA